MKRNTSRPETILLTENKSPRRRHAVSILFLILAACLAYSNNFTAEFVYDDYPFIVENPAVRTLSAPLRFFIAREAFSSGGGYVIYRPLAALSFAVNYALSGYQPASYHTVNILLHIMCGLLIYYLFNAIFRNALYAFFVALLFLVHPVQTEAVSWVSARGNPLFLMFLLLSLICYRKWTSGADRKSLYYTSALVFALLSLLAKEMAVVLPVLLMVFDATINRPESKDEWRRRIAAWVPFGLLSLLYVLARHAVLGETKQMEYWGGSFWTSFLTMNKAFAYYVRLMFLPRPLMVEYIVPIAHSPLQPTVLISAALLLSLAILLLFSRNRYPVISFGIAWFFASLLPVSNIIPLQAIINERFLYLSSIGFCAILASPMLFLAKRVEGGAFRAFMAALVLIAFCYGTLALDRNRDWRDSLSLWTASVKASPIGTTSRYNLGLELYRRRRYDEAIEHLKVACRFQEHFPSAHGLLGNVYLAKGEWEAAIREYEIGLAQAPEDARIQHNLALAWFEKGTSHAQRRETEQATRSFLAALEYEPELLQARDSLRDLLHLSSPENPVPESQS